MVGKTNADQNRRALMAHSPERKPGALRCPACLLIRDHMAKDFTCTLSRCPRVFVSIDPQGGPQPAARAEG